MKALALILGIVGIVVGIGLGMYVAFYLLLAGGIAGLVTAFSIIGAGGTANGLVAFSLLKISCFAFGGYVSAMAIILPSNLLINYALEGS